MAASRRPAPYSATASTSAAIDGLGAVTSTRSPNSAAVLAVCGPITPITVTACGLPAMPTRFRTVDDEVNSTASKPPPLMASRIGAGGAVGGDVLGLPAEVDQPRQQGLGGDVRARQQHPVDRVEQVIVRRPGRGEALGRLVSVGHQVRPDAEVEQRRRGLLADGSD